VLVDGQGRVKGKGNDLHDHEEEDCVEWQQEDEHDDGFDGEKEIEIHVCCLDRREVVFVSGYACEGEVAVANPCEGPRLDI
jgi:hypothetical protein